MTVAPIPAVHSSLDGTKRRSYITGMAEGIRLGQVTGLPDELRVSLAKVSAR
jgi:hypothetical protein